MRRIAILTRVDWCRARILRDTIASVRIRRGDAGGGGRRGGGGGGGSSRALWRPRVGIGVITVGVTGDGVVRVGVLTVMIALGVFLLAQGQGYLKQEGKVQHRVLDSVTFTSSNQTPAAFSFDHEQREGG